MAKKTLKNALRAHEAKKSQAARAKAAEEAAERRHAAVVAASSGQGSVGNRAIKRKRRREDGDAAGPSTTRDAIRSKHSNISTNGDGAHGHGPRRKTPVRMVEADDTVLLVGEGNFSFARALLQPPHSHPPHLVLATAFDTEEQCYSKYPDAKEHVSEIRRLAGRDSIVAFGVDAGDLTSAKALSISTGSSTLRACWSKIIFNFPHVGAGHKDETRNVMANQLMLLRFLISAAGLLTRGPLPGPVEKAKGKAAGTKKDQDDIDDDDEEEDSVVSSGDDNLDDEGEGRGHPSKKASSSAKTTKRILAPVRAGSLLVTIRDVKPYTLWDIPTLAKRPHDVLPAIARRAPALPRGQKLPSTTDLDILAELAAPEETVTKKRSDKAVPKERKHGYRVWRSFIFDPDDWPGYAHRRTLGWREGVSTDHNEDITRMQKTDDGREVEARGQCRTFELALQS